VVVAVGARTKGEEAENNPHFHLQSFLRQSHYLQWFKTTTPSLNPTRSVGFALIPLFIKLSVLVTIEPVIFAH
jgi:hypothetical protein